MEPDSDQSSTSTYQLIGKTADKHGGEAAQQNPD